MSKEWLNEQLNITYNELFQLIMNNSKMKEIFNAYKLSELSFDIIYSIYSEINKKSPYDNSVMTEDIKYVNGDATNPIGEGHKYILHICNDIGGWGKGFVLSLSSKWPRTKEEYKKWFKNKNLDDDYGNNSDFELGNIQIIDVDNDISVVNMIAQHGIYPIKQNGNIIQPIRYEELEKCLQKFYNFVKDEKDVTINMPLIGAGLAGGDWRIIENIIKKELSNKGIRTIVHILKKD